MLIILYSEWDSNGVEYSLNTEQNIEYLFFNWASAFTCIDWSKGKHRTWWYQFEDFLKYGQRGRLVFRGNLSFDNS